jgi:hypothetical protein
MAGGSGQMNPLRQAILALVMAALLAAAVGAAWLLEGAAEGRVRAGVEILRHIGARGLGQYWTGPSRLDWSLIRYVGQVRGWRVVAREQTAQGEGAPDQPAGFRGATVEALTERSGQASRLIRSRWTLSDDATRGEYLGSRSAATGQVDTRISLLNRQVTVRQSPFGLEARSPAPDNYVPEGALRLVLGEIARRQGDAQFTMVFDEEPAVRGQVEFKSIRVRYLGSGQSPAGQATRRVRLTHRGWGNIDVTYELDSSGEVISTATDDGLEWVPSTREEVLRLYPYAQVELARW